MIVLKAQNLVGEDGFNEGEVTQLMSKLVPYESLLCSPIIRRNGDAEKSSHWAAHAPT